MIPVQFHTEGFDPMDDPWSCWEIEGMPVPCIGDTITRHVNTKKAPFDFKSYDVVGVDWQIRTYDNGAAGLRMAIVTVREHEPKPEQEESDDE